MQVETDTGRSVTTPAELAAHLVQLRAHRAELREAVGAVELALEIPLARQGPWRERVRAALTELQHDFARHVALTESAGGIYDRARHSAPRLCSAVDRLLAEHRDLTVSIARQLTALEQADATDDSADPDPTVMTGPTVPTVASDTTATTDLSALREELTVLTGRLRRHRQAGGDLVYEAYDVDLGGSG
ncbi:MAG: hypothetical protein ABI336_08900 [Humibacillus sp.]